MSTAEEQKTSQSGSLKASDFVWHELRTTDAKAAGEFYSHVIGWKPKSSENPGGMPYTLLTVDGVDTAGLMQLTPQMLADGMKPAWFGFVGVDDVDATAARLEQAGGKLHCAPMDIPGIGRFAPVEDPQGTEFLLFKGSIDSAPPPLPPGTQGTVGWNELSANDGETAWPFYSRLFGWAEETQMDMGPMGIYRIFNNGGSAIGAVMTRDPKMSSRPFWLYYINVQDIDTAAERIREKNGVILMGPHEVPGPMWIIVANDPQGAMFAVVGHRKSSV